MPEQKNPAELQAAVIFTIIYAVVLLAVAFAKDYFGAAGLYIVSVFSGLTDMDAITLSTAHLPEAGGVDTATAWRAAGVWCVPQRLWGISPPYPSCWPRLATFTSPGPVQERYIHEHADPPHLDTAVRSRPDVGPAP
jgi:hypothetical protein